MNKLLFKFTLFCLVLFSSFKLLVSKVFALGIFGNIDPPINNAYTQAGTEGQGLFLFFQNLFTLVGTIGGLYFVFQLISAGFMYLSANGDTKKVEQSTNKITQAALGMVVIASAFVIAGLVTRFTGIQILNPTINGPN